MNAPLDLQQALGELLGDARLKVCALPDTDLQLWLIDGDNMDREFSQEEIQRILHEPPYWGFCWASGLAVARYLAEFPEWVRGKRVLDFGAGSGIAGIAAVKAGAQEVVACDLDPLAISACRANATLNGVEMKYSTDFFAEADRFDLILVADVLYDRANLPLLDAFLSRGREALVADSRVRDFRHPLYERIEMLEAMTLPDLAEPEEFRHVSLYHARRLLAKASAHATHLSKADRFRPHPAKPYSCPIHASTRSPMSQQTPYIFDATTADFDQSVIEASFNKPVLVDFWAEWCAPCKALMPMLQGVAESYQGELLLAKVNCDIEQDIVARFGIRSLPTVVLFKDGQPVDGFAGAQPESAVRALLEPHVQMPPPAAADPFEQAQALFDDGRYADAEAALVVMLNEDNTNAKALILYARCLTERGELDEAQTVLDAVKSDEHKAALAGAKAQIKFLGLARDLPDAADLKARLAKDPQDDEAVYQLAIQQLARQQYEAALEALLKLFIRNRSYGEGLPHKTLLQVFELLGNDHPLVTVYRRKMFAALY